MDEAEGKVAQVAQVNESVELNQFEVKKVQQLNVVLPIKLFLKLKRYQDTKATRKESQSYIVSEALEMWFHNKGFE